MQEDDPRYRAIYDGLNQLSSREIRRILLTPDDNMVYDGCNYCEETDRYCPLAVALRVPAMLSVVPRAARTNQLVDDLLGVVGRALHPGFQYNQLHGIPGTFYRDRRATDICFVCIDVLRSRGERVHV